jgi:hypothetical protein
VPLEEVRASESEDELERNMYLDESIDKIEDEKEEEEDNYDICPDNYEIGFGQSHRSPT